MREISDMDLYHLCRNRPVCNPDRRHSISVVWPARPATAYDRKRDKVFAQADAANNAAQGYVDELNAQRFLKG
jgi:hypothetical protein